MPRRKCLYDVLGVPKTIDGAELKKVYRQLALKFHPDKNIEEPERAKRVFQEIQVRGLPLSTSAPKGGVCPKADIVLEISKGG